LIENPLTLSIKVNGSCGECLSCLDGYIAMCERAPKQYGQTTFNQGSFSTGAVWDGRFVYKIPENMSSETAAPMILWWLDSLECSYWIQPQTH
jgi:D-arabinose 1-dehydrogenase-like Zn-dependent alcohol dehydrogenase